MVTQYPYTLEEYQVADAVLGTTGDWSQPDATWVTVSVCRMKGNGGGRLVKLTDGNSHCLQRINSTTENLSRHTNRGAGSGFTRN